MDRYLLQCSEAEERLKAAQDEAFKLAAELRTAGEPAPPPIFSTLARAVIVQGAFRHNLAPHDHKGREI